MRHRRKPALIPEWKSAWRRFASFKLSTVGFTLATTWLALPQKWQDSITDLAGPYATNVGAIAMFLSIMVGRVLYLKPHDDAKPVATEPTTTGADLDSSVKEDPPPQ